MDLNFGTAPVPTVTVNRVKEPNPFEGKFPTPEGQSLTLSFKGDTEANKEILAKVTRKAREAAAAIDKSARVHTVESEEGTGKNKSVVTSVSIWTVDKITRTRKGNGTPE